MRLLCLHGWTLLWVFVSLKAGIAGLPCCCPCHALILLHQHARLLWFRAFQIPDHGSLSPSLCTVAVHDGLPRCPRWFRVSPLLFTVFLVAVWKTPSQCGKAVDSSLVTLLRSAITAFRGGIVNEISTPPNSITESSPDQCFCFCFCQCDLVFRASSVLSCSS